MIAIHHVEGSFSDRWIEYLETFNIEYKIIDLMSSDLISTIRDLKIKTLLFHVNTKEYKNSLFLKDIVRILEKEGVKVFPENSTFWHYDDKLLQKYLFEQLEITHAPMHVFYDIEKALTWVNQKADYPFVFKLKGGAGSRNVKLVKTPNNARKLVHRMFGSGFKPIPSILNDPGPIFRKHKKRNDWIALLKRAPRTIRKLWTANNFQSREKGYFLAQDFYPDNSFDTRVAIIGNKAQAFRRRVRSNDFRASGSGLVEYDGIDTSMIKMAFIAADKIGGTSLAFDFIYNKMGDPVILEVSYCFAKESALKYAKGYWDRNLIYYKGQIIPEDEIIQTVLGLSSK